MEIGDSNRISPIESSNQKSFFKQLSNQRGNLIIILGIVFIMLVLGVVGYFLATRNNQTNSSNRENSTSPLNTSSVKDTASRIKGDWKGVIWTSKGFITTDSMGKVERDSSGQYNFTLPTGMSLEYVYKNFTGISNNGEDIFKNAFQLLYDGRIVFIGSPEVTTASQRDTLYSWIINSSDNPKPLFKIPNGQKIQRFTLSPNNNQIAVISVTRDELGLYEGIGDVKTLPFNTLKNETEKRHKQLAEELGTIHIFNIGAQQSVKTLKIDKGDGYSRLAWKGNYLYVFNSYMYWVFDMSNYQIVYTSSTSESGPIGDHITISPDGTKFINVSEQLIKVIPTKENLVSFESPTDVGYNAFSFDSKKLLVQKPKTTNAPVLLGDADKIGELNLGDGKINIIGSLDSLIPGLQLDVSNSERDFYLPFVVYNPTGEYIIFPIIANGDTSRFVDLYYLKVGEQRATQNNFGPIQLNTVRDFAFVGWYK